MKVIIELPYRLPTWNRLLAMGQWKRKAVRDLIHQSISTLQVTASGNEIRMEPVSKPASMALWRSAYYKTIAAKKSKALPIKQYSPKKKKGQSLKSLRDLKGDNW